jgi:hypothetical protein
MDEHLTKTRGQKGADKVNDPVLCLFAAARVTTEFEILSENYRQPISTRSKRASHFGFPITHLAV